MAWILPLPDKKKKDIFQYYWEHWRLKGLWWNTQWFFFHYHLWQSNSLKNNMLLDENMRSTRLCVLWGLITLKRHLNTLMGTQVLWFFSLHISNVHKNIYQEVDFQNSYWVFTQYKCCCFKVRLKDIWFAKAHFCSVCCIVVFAVRVLKRWAIRSGICNLFQIA